MTRTDTAAELDFHASGFIVKVQGSWTDDALHQFRHFLNLRLIFPSDDELLGALQRAKAGYLAGAAEQFRFDPVHDHGKPSACLKSLEYLLGHFRGEGRYAMTDYNFQKEVIGSFEAGSRFIALRMDASYPLADGRKDVHKALVILGSETSSGEITAHAYTDGGIVRRYEVSNDQGVLCFADHPPGHAGQWKRARKILNPTREGFEERLEVDGGDGSFVPYYVVCMRRVGT